MKIKHLLTKTLLVAAGLLVGQSVWATPTVIKTYDFDAATDAVADQTVLAYSGSTKINNVGCDNLTGDWSGLAVQGAGSWHIYHKNGKGALAGKGYYNNNGGGRMFALLNLQAGDVVRITADAALPSTAFNGTYDSEKSTEGSDCYYTVTANGNFAITTTARYHYIHVVTVTRDLADLEKPTYEITGANGNERQVTLSCLTDGAAIKYNTTDDKSAAGWTSYSAPFYTSEATLYAYSEKNSNTSDVVTITTGAGTTIKLNAPTLTKTAYSAGEYTVSITSDQSNLSVVPTTHIIKYSIDGGAATTLVSSPIQIAEGSTVSAYVELSGYTTSSTTECVTAARPTNYATSWTQDYTNITSASGNGAYGVVLNGSADFNVDGTDMKNIIGYTYNEATVPTSLNTNVGLSTSTSFFLRCNGGNSGILKNLGAGYLGIQNLKVGDVIVITTSGSFLSATYGVTLNEGMCTNTEYYFTATETEASIAVSAGTYNYIKDITVLSSTVPATISAAGWATLYTPYALDFSTLSSEIEAYTATLGVSTVTLNKVDNVPANTGVVLKKIGGTGSYDIPVIASSSTPKGDLTGNASADTPYDAGTNRYYLALNGESKAQFKKLTSGSIAAGKAFLETAVTAPVLNVVLGDENVTGIADVRSKMEDVRGNIFDLQGRKVAQPTKGLYIVNGKKIVVK